MRTRRSFLKAAGAGGALLLPACRRAADDAAGSVSSPPTGAIRIDLRHTVREGAHAFELIRLQRERYWPRRTVVQLPEWGDFRVSVSAPGDTLIYREGFDSTIDVDARGATAELSVRMPAPAATVRVSIERRRAGAFPEIGAFELDPSQAGDAPATGATTRVDALLASGPAEAKVDLVLLGDGYREQEHPKFIADANRALEYLFSVEPFAPRVRDFNATAIFAPSPDSGATDRYRGRRSDTVLRAAYGEGQAERTLAIGDNRILRDLASTVPYDVLLVLVNARRYGGSAYFGGPAVVAIDSAAARYLVLHELGHVIGGLAEEYYVPEREGPVYRGSIEPWHPNVTLSVPSTKWQAPDQSPSPWNKAEYEGEFRKYVRAYERLREKHAGEQAVETLMRVAQERQRTLLSKNAPLRRTGYFEGAHGYAQGVYRCEVDCIMFSLQTRYFCKACEAALNRMMDALT